LPPRLLVLAALLSTALVAGCDGSVDRMSRAAESARSATERMAVSSAAASAAREKQAYADAEDMRSQMAIAEASALGGRPRYEIRKDGSGWTVYDTANRRPARLEGKTQAGLSREEAESTFAGLIEEEAAIEAQFGLGGSRR
jgi:hypothetical protein